MTKKNKQIIGTLVGAALAFGAGFYYNSFNKPELPVVATDGKVSGLYSIESIMSLGKPYICNFEKTEGDTAILGTMQTDGSGVYGEFRISTKLLDNKEFNSFLIIKEGKAYTWTSLASVGFKSSVAKSAKTNASPSEQAQIVGLRDKIQYECKPSSTIDASTFEAPDWITFKEA